MRAVASPLARFAATASAIAAGYLITRRLIERPAYSFRGRTVVITGGSRGLGFAMARLLADEGARVWLVARTADALARAAADIASRGGQVRTIAADVRDRDDVQRIVSTVAIAEEAIDVLINNAGVITVGPFEHAQEEDFRNSLATHFWAPLDLIRVALPYLRRTGDGRIVNISSIGGRIAVPHLTAYAAGKFALAGLSECLHAELKKEGITVTTVTPGLMRTGSYVNVALRGRHEQEMQWFGAMSSTPLTAMNADRAAHQIIEACRQRRATLTTTWQARLAVALNGLVPETMAAINAAVDEHVLPQPTTSGRGEAARTGTTVDPGAVKAVLSAETRAEFHQPKPAWAGSGSTVER